MEHTIVGLFSDNSQAQRAVEQLEKAGIGLKYIDVARKPGQGVDANDEPNINNSWGQSDKLNDNNLTRFFKSLFETDDNLPEHYDRVADSDHAIVTVVAPTRQLAEKAADILDSCGAQDVNDRTREQESPDIDRINDAAGVQDHQRPEQPTQGPQHTRRSRIFEGSIEDHMRMRDRQPPAASGSSNPGDSPDTTGNI